MLPASMHMPAPAPALHLHLHLYSWSVSQGAGGSWCVSRRVRRYHRRGYDQSVSQRWEDAGLLEQASRAEASFP